MRKDIELELLTSFSSVDARGVRIHLVAYLNIVQTLLLVLFRSFSYLFLYLRKFAKSMSNETHV